MWTQPVHTFSPSTHTAQPTNYHTSRWVQAVSPQWPSSKPVGGQTWKQVLFFHPLQIHLFDEYNQRADALALVTSAISAGIFNDLGSGSNVDACIITASHTEMLRNFIKPNERVQKENTYRFRRGTTAWKSEHIRSLIVSEEVSSIGGEAMDTT